MASRRSEGELLVLLVMLAALVAGAVIVVRLSQNGPAIAATTKGVAMLNPGGATTPAWSNDESWTIQRGSDGHIASIAVHRSVHVAARA